MTKKYQEVERQTLEKMEIINLGKKITHFLKLFFSRRFDSILQTWKKEQAAMQNELKRKHPWKLK